MITNLFHRNCVWQVPSEEWWLERGELRGPWPGADTLLSQDRVVLSLMLRSVGLESRCFPCSQKVYQSSRD